MFCLRAARAPTERPRKEASHVNGLANARGRVFYLAVNRSFARSINVSHLTCDIARYATMVLKHDHGFGCAFGGLTNRPSGNEVSAERSAMFRSNLMRGDCGVNDSKAVSDLRVERGTNSGAFCQLCGSPVEVPVSGGSVPGHHGANVATWLPALYG